MKIERTRDWERVRSIVTHPKVYGAVTDDYSLSAEEWKPNETEDICYLLVSEDEKPLGVFILIPQNHICWQVHTCFLPESYGDIAKRAGFGSIQWVWDNTECLRIVTEVPIYNRIALKYALDCGMKEYGINPKSYMKQGKLRDVILLGISKCQ
jgi:RimJ/RimL family protein N-acetyltransferase